MKKGSSVCSAAGRRHETGCHDTMNRCRARPFTLHEPKKQETRRDNSSRRQQTLKLIHLRNVQREDKKEPSIDTEVSLVKQLL